MRYGLSFVSLSMEHKLYITYTEQRFANNNDSPYSTVSVVQFGKSHLFVEPRFINKPTLKKLRG